MKNFQHPEFHILHKLLQVQAKHPDIAELDGLVTEVRDIINENAVSIMQTASLYALLGRPGDLSPETRQKLQTLLAGAQKCLDDETS